MRSLVSVDDAAVDASVPESTTATATTVGNDDALASRAGRGGDGRTMFAVAIISIVVIMCWMVVGLVARKHRRAMEIKASEAFERALEESERRRAGRRARAWEDRTARVTMPGSVRGEEVVVLGVREVVDARGMDVDVGEEEGEDDGEEGDGKDETREGDAARTVETTVVGSDDAV